MAVPNTNTFSLQDVVDELSPGSDDLLSCIAIANSALFDSTYYTSPVTSLMEFRNYGAVNTLGLYVSGEDFVVDNRSSFSSVTLEWEYISQSGTGTATVKDGSTTVSAGYTTDTVYSGATALVFQDEPWSTPFTVLAPLTGKATVIFGLKITASTVDAFPTSQITISKLFQ